MNRIESDACWFQGELLERMGSGTPPITDKPLVVRVNFATASASEILAAALRDNCRAPLVGTKTFGYGAPLLGIEPGTSDPD